MTKLTFVGVEEGKTQKGTAFCKYKDSAGNIHTAWDENIINQIKLGTEIDLIMKVSPDGKFSNIRGIINGTSDPTETFKPAKAFNDEPKASPIKPNSNSRDKSIIAQCLTKVFWANNNAQAESDILKSYNYFLENL
tara:strand:+ start:349 stop:756 length:408 start_codon:yes stop_codon:yes gene_type:complete